MSSALDMIRGLLDENITVKLRGNRELSGRLHAFDEHCNIVLSDAQEKHFILKDGKVDVQERKFDDILFVRGDSVIFVKS